MVHIDEPPPTLEEVLALMRPGDVLTHCFRPFPNTPATADGKVEPFVQAARERGIIFDVGHGKGSFAFRTGRADAGAEIHAGLHIERRSYALHTGAGLRSADNHVEVLVHGHAA